MPIKCRVQRTDGKDPPGTIETFLDLPRVGESIDLSRGAFTVDQVLHHAEGAVENSPDPSIDLYVRTASADEA